MISLAYAVMMTLAFGLMYTHIIRNNIESDLQVHAQACADITSGKMQYSGTFLMYWLVNLLTLFSGNYDQIIVALISLILVGLVWKNLLLLEAIKNILPEKISFLVATCAIFYFGIPFLFFVKDKYFLMSNQSPNLFHNSSSILVYPLSFLLFNEQIQYWRFSDRKYLVRIFLFILLSAFIKPSFLLAYLIATPLMSYFLFGFEKKTFRFYLPSVSILLIIAFQAIIIYYFQIGRLLQQESHITLSYLDFWSILYPKIYYPISLTGTFLFPGLFLMLTILDKKPTEFYFAWLLVFVSILIYIFISETGPRRFHGNFSWQISLSYYVLLIVVLKNWFTLIKAKSISQWKNVLLTIAFLLHAASGIIYLYRFLILGDYN